jgi:hypothetical protein
MMKVINVVVNLTAFIGCKVTLRHTSDVDTKNRMLFQAHIKEYVTVPIFSVQNRTKRFL